MNGTGPYKDILENNVDFDKSFNSDLMLDNTLRDHNSALFGGKGFKQNCEVNQLHSILHCILYIQYNNYICYLLTSF